MRVQVEHTYEHGGRFGITVVARNRVGSSRQECSGTAYDRGLVNQFGRKYDELTTVEGSSNVLARAMIVPTFAVATVNRLLTVPIAKFLPASRESIVGSASSFGMFIGVFILGPVALAIEISAMRRRKTARRLQTELKVLRPQLGDFSLQSAPSEQIREFDRRLGCGGGGPPGANDRLDVLEREYVEVLASPANRIAFRALIFLAPVPVAALVGGAVGRGFSNAVRSVNPAVAFGQARDLFAQRIDGANVGVAVRVGGFELYCIVLVVIAVYVTSQIWRLTSGRRQKRKLMLLVTELGTVDATRGLDSRLRVARDAGRNRPMAAIRDAFIVIPLAAIGAALGTVGTWIILAIIGGIRLAFDNRAFHGDHYNYHVFPLLATSIFVAWFAGFGLYSAWKFDE